MTTRRRVFHTPEGEILEVLYPAPAARLPDEDEQDFMERVYARRLEVAPHLKGVPYFDLDHAELPARTTACGDCGDEHSVRNLWVVKKGTVHIDAKAPNLHAAVAHAQQALAVELEHDEPRALYALQLDHYIRKLAHATNLPRAEGHAVVRAFEAWHKKAKPQR